MIKHRDKEVKGVKRYSREPRNMRIFWSRFWMYQCLIRTPEYRRAYCKLKKIFIEKEKSKFAEYIKQEFNLSRIINPYNNAKNNVDDKALNVSAFRNGSLRSMRKDEFKLPDFVKLSSRDEDILQELKAIIKDAKKKSGYDRSRRDIKLKFMKDYLKVWDMKEDGLSTWEIAIKRNPHLSKAKIGDEYAKINKEEYEKYDSYCNELIDKLGIDSEIAEKMINKKFPKLVSDPKASKLKSEMKKIREQYAMAARLIEGGMWRYIK
ncbi:MAG: hypothetical protein PHO67_03980 [Candidatus Omnitrophica bacterium]|nr:hypothetical protein [Candidatus Omnitrophota bacterium]